MLSIDGTIINRKCAILPHKQKKFRKNQSSCLTHTTPKPINLRTENKAFLYYLYEDWNYRVLN